MTGMLRQLRQPRESRRRNRRRKPARLRRKQHLLEVRARSRKVREQRKRLAFTVFCRFVLLAAVIGGLHYGGSTLFDRLFFANPDYNLVTIEIEGNQSIPGETLLGLADVVTGRNLFRIDIERVRDRLESHPQVQGAEVERILPDALAIRIVEREPVAWLVPGDSEGDPYAVGRSYLVDSHGVLMRTTRLHPEFMHLPLITGLDSEALAAGQALDSLELRAALDLILVNNHRLASVPLVIRSVDLSSRFCLEVTAASHATIRFAYDDPESQLRKLELLVEHAEAIGREIESVSLVPKRNIPVRFLPVVNEGGEELAPAGGALPVRRAMPAGERAPQPQ